MVEEDETMGRVQWNERPASSVWRCLRARRGETSKWMGGDCEITFPHSSRSADWTRDDWRAPRDCRDATTTPTDPKILGRRWLHGTWKQRRRASGAALHSGARGREKRGQTS
ncbi:hypothetical protein PFISCL1PPCAC_18621, partial [Pristionchus fissidentatus]